MSANRKAWMTQEFFAGWLKSFDEVMVAEKRCVVLILDNCSTHNVQPQLSAVRLKFLPANTTAKSQPLDWGVIATVKALYKKRMCERVVLKLQREEPLKVDLRAAINRITASWWQVKATTIQKCFRNAGFVRDAGNSEDADLRSDAIDEAIGANDVWSSLVENRFVPANDKF
ncbi:hypothetical protein HPB47_008495 [Ixodes persulcatus]|uniref:Uncharacterized protein n=1 Tax=Ixodes persulcatus TaxID=34615 RepID=A0AC60P4V5_IXOPE|nr:hypothetical protein HPB47_008495 [Ixodes persulcatus]